MSNINVSEIVKNTKQHVWVGAIYYIFVIPIMIGLIIGSITMGEFSIYLIFLLFILGIIGYIITEGYFLDLLFSNVKSVSGEEFIGERLEFAKKKCGDEIIVKSIKGDCIKLKYYYSMKTKILENNTEYIKNINKFDKKYYYLGLSKVIIDIKFIEKVD